MTENFVSEQGEQARGHLRVALVISGLEGGGTERQVVLLAMGLRARGHEVQLILRRSGGQFFEEAVQAGLALRLISGSPLRRALRIRRMVRAEKIDVVYGFLPESNIVVGLLRFAGCRATLIQGIRSSKFDLSQFPFRIRLAYLLSSLMTFLGDGVVFNSRAGADSYRLVSRLAKNRTVIANGFDTTRFSPDQRAAEIFRQRYQIDSHSPIAAYVGRIDPLKGIDVLLSAMCILQRQDRLPVIILFGAKNETDLVGLRARVFRLGLSERVKIEPFLLNPEQVFRSVDLVVLPSISEGFPNVLVEAILCGARVAATDVGDVRWIMDHSADLAVPGDAQSLAKTIDKALSQDVDTTLPARIAERFSESEMVKATENYFYSLRQSRE